MNNEEKILELLVKQGAVLEKHTEMLGQITDRLDRVESRLDRVESRLDRVESRLDRVESRLDKVEAAQAEMRSDISAMQETLTRVAVTQEGIVLPRLQALYESHETIMEAMDNLASASYVAELASDLDTVKEVVRITSQDVAMLKKAL